MRLIVCLSLLTSVAYADALSEPLQRAADNAKEIRSFVDVATDKYGDIGKQAAEFLVQGMPEQDLKQLDQGFLLENLSLALEARERFPWSKAIPDEVFFNDVLPYASLDETREPWRKEFYDEVADLVSDCKTTTEAAQAINQSFFNVIKVHYNTGRKRPNQSPSESIELGMATCTGLSIILVDACRSVGVPARVAGTPLWTNKRGNHTWVEIWDGGEWHFTGADEYDAKGLNRGWFVNDASKAIANDWKHAIWATSWRKTGDHFPMVWSRSNRSVAAVNVTSNYAREPKQASDKVIVYFRVFEKPGGNRLAATIKVSDGSDKVLGKLVTKTGQADLNDMPSLELPSNSEYQVELEFGGETRTAKMKVGAAAETTQQWNWSELQRTSSPADSAATVPATGESIQSQVALLPENRDRSIPEGSLSREEAEQAIELIWNNLRQEQLAQREEELEAKLIKAAGKEMKYLEKVFGDAPEGEKSLWISMHGGGGAPARVNDRQWQNQIRLYKPEEGIVIAPRAPTNSWNLWHEGHIDALFDRLIESYVLLRGVDPERIYLMGYSAGGDGVYQLAPRMADRFAAASMMAGHPNDASALGLRNLPFMIFMGGDDAAYKRNEVAAQWKVKLSDLENADPDGYPHKVTIYEGLGHWMQGKDAEALPWMASRSRTTWPKKIVWEQSGRTHERFYWLAVPKAVAKARQVVRAEAKQQRIDIETEGDVDQLTLRLNDALVNLDEPLEVVVNGKSAFSGKVPRTAVAISNSLAQRMDRTAVATAELSLTGLTE